MAGIFNSAIFNNAVFNTGLTIKGGRPDDYVDYGRDFRAYSRRLSEVYQEDDEKILAIIMAFVNRSN